MQVDITFDMASFEEHSKGAQRALVRARNKAAVETLYYVKARFRDQIKQQFNNPKPYVYNSVIVQTKSLMGNNPNFIGKLYVNDHPSRGGTAANEILYPHIHGGVRQDKRGERRLRAMGVLPGNLQAVPTKDYRDSRGNIKSGLMTKILSDINAFPEYMSMNRINSGNVQAYKRSRVKSARFFVMNKDDGKIPRGIYEIVGKSSRATRRLKMVMAFVPIKYDKRLYFYELAEKAFSPTVFGAQFAHYARLYTRSGSPDFARFARAQRNFRRKVRQLKTGNTDFGPAIPRTNIPNIRRGATVGGGFFKR